MMVQQVGHALPIHALWPQRVVDGLRVFPVFFRGDGQPQVAAIERRRGLDQPQTEGLRPRRNEARRVPAVARSPTPPTAAGWPAASARNRRPARPTPHCLPAPLPPPTARPAHPCSRSAASRAAPAAPYPARATAGAHPDSASGTGSPSAPRAGSPASTRQRCRGSRAQTRCCPTRWTWTRTPRWPPRWPRRQRGTTLGVDSAEALICRRRACRG